MPKKRNIMKQMFTAVFKERKFPTRFFWRALYTPGHTT